MKVFKYKEVRTKVDMGEAKLNEFGRRGYELVSVITDEHGFTYYFKVEVSEQ